MIFLAHLSSKLKQGNCRYASSLSLCKLFQSLREQCVSLWETRGCLQFVLNTVAARFFTLLPQPSPASQGRENLNRFLKFHHKVIVWDFFICLFIVKRAIFAVK